MKKALLTILATILFVPVLVHAEDAVLYEKLYKILGEDGKLVIEEIDALNLAALEGNAGGEESGAYDTSYTSVISSYIYNLDEVQSLIKEYEDESPKVSVFCLSYTNCGITMNYKSDQRGTTDSDEYPIANLKHYDVSINIQNDYDKAVYDFIKKSFKVENGVAYKDYYLYDLAYINQLYTMNNGLDNLISVYNNYPNTILKAYPEIKEIFNENKNVSLKYGKPSYMGNVWTNVEFVQSADYVAYNNTTAYMEATLRLHLAPVIYVSDTTADEDLIDAAETRIKEYLNTDQIKVEIEDITPTFADDAEIEAIFSDLDEFLAATTKETRDENARIYSLQIGSTKTDKNFFIIKTSDANIKDLEVKAYDNSVGLMATSTSIEVPLDSTLEVTDVTTTVKKANSKVEAAYDINMYSGMKDAYIEKVAEGLKIYIPVADDFDNADKKIAYLNEKNEIEESFTFKEETVDGQKYLTFTTTHLSTYAIVNNSAKNPDTSDSSIIILLIASVLFIGLFLKARKSLKFMQD